MTCWLCLPKPCQRPNPFDQGSRLANVAQIFGSPGTPSKVCGGDVFVLLVCVPLFSNFGLEQIGSTKHHLLTPTPPMFPTTKLVQEAKHRIQDPEVPCLFGKTVCIDTSVVCFMFFFDLIFWKIMYHSNLFCIMFPCIFKKIT